MDSMKEEKRNLDSQLWHACAGGMVEIPSINSKVFYFPQGHAEQAHGDLDFGGSPRISPLILCRVSAVRFMADSETDEVFAEMSLIPLRGNDFHREEDDWTGGNNQSESEEKHTSFAKTLTQSDANNGGGFSVPRYCAETIFPPLDYSANPPVQTIHAKDVHCQIWKFRHIYRGTPRRHLLTTGWSNFINCKRLVAGDSIVFLKSKNGELQIGIRRAKRGIGGRFDFSIPPLARNLRGDPRGKVTAESIIKAVNLALSGQAFAVKHFPLSNTPEFIVKASAVRAAMQVLWSTGMRFKMAFETEDSSRISWFMGTISSIQPADPIRWPDSPWRLLQVTWDEPDLLQNVKFVNPWSVEAVTDIIPYHVSPFAPQRKKLRLLSSPPSLSTDFVSPPTNFSRMLDHNRAGIQGARHAKSLNLPLKDLREFQATSLPIPKNNLIDSETKSYWPNVENPTKIVKENEMKTPHILLFGQVILPGQRVFKGNSKYTTGNSSTEKTDTSYGAATSPHWNSSPENLSDAGFPWSKDHQKTVLESGLRKELVDQLFFMRDYFSIP